MLNGDIVRHRLSVLLILFYLFVFAQFTFGQDVSPAATLTTDTLAKEAAARQYRIYCDALMQGSTALIRSDAAVSLLLQNNVQSRDFLLSALISEDNPEAVNAVCEALVKSRGLSQKIDSLEVFLEPLLEILQAGSQEQAKLAAEAMLLYPYQDLSKSLKSVLNDPEVELSLRLNVVYALQLRSEPTALEDLIRLLDNPEPEIVKTAETALQESFGIPVGTSRMDWSSILAELKLKTPEEIGKERLLRQEMKLKEVQAERDRWQKLYLGSLDKQYELLDEETQIRLVSDQMASDLPALRLWGLDRASKYAILPESFRPKVLALLEDDSREVRLQTAKALMSMSAIDPATVLLERYRAEEDPEVALAMFEALGEACFFAFSPGSSIELSKEIKLETLNIASENYLMLDSPEPVRIAAEVIRKILELNNLNHDSMNDYLALLKKRYEMSIAKDGQLRADLLGILAHLCGQGGAKDLAADMYEPLFRKALESAETPALRLAAAQGLAYVDRVGALELFKKNNLMNDESMAIQGVVIDLAGQTGDSTDLEWLLGTLSVNGHAEQVWISIRGICERQSARFLLSWLPALQASSGSKAEYVRDILTIAEQKAVGEGDSYLLGQIQEKTVKWFFDSQAMEQGAVYVTGIADQIGENGFSDQTKLQILQLALYGGLVEIASQVIENKLVKGDISHSSEWMAALDGYFFDEKVDDAAKLRVYRKFILLEFENRPDWDTFVKDIHEQFKFTVESELSDNKEGLQESNKADTE